MQLLSGSTAAGPKSAVLVGFESVGKSALFRGLSGRRLGEEANFRGSTVVCRRCRVPNCECELVDTPGIRLEVDSATTRLALGELAEADVVIVVARATDVERELGSLTRELELGGRQAIIAVTFSDKVQNAVEATREISERYGVPALALNARELDSEQRAQLVRALAAARPLTLRLGAHSPRLPIARVIAADTVFDWPRLGPPLALLSLVASLVLPVMLAYAVSEQLQPLADAQLIEPVEASLGALPPILSSVLTGPYGLLTLGPYSFIWAFPVVAFVGLASAIGQESGLYDRITTALDPWLRRVALTGRDLVPLLTGFGCNVVAVLQTRSCSACTRQACVGAVAFGSACSYQIGATLSLFGSAGLAWLFLPYLLLVLGVGIVHTRLWHAPLAAAAIAPQRERAFLQWPAPGALWWQFSSGVGQFLKVAMPIFLSMCVLAALLAHAGIMAAIAGALSPLFGLLGLPSDVALPVVLSVLRKDGILLLNQDGGALLRSLTSGQVFVAVFLAGTLTACLVTLWTVRRELGWRAALQVLGRQALTSLVATGLLACLFAT